MLVVVPLLFEVMYQPIALLGEHESGTVAPEVVVVPVAVTALW